MSTPPSTAAAAAAAIRQDLTDALAAELVGPFHPSDPGERLPRPPSRWYLTGFLAPESHREAIVAAVGGPQSDEVQQVADAETDDELEAGSDDPETPAPEPKTKRRSLWPASVGLSVLVPSHASTVEATVSWADYLPEESPTNALEDEGPDDFASRDVPPTSGAAQERQARIWRRIPRSPTLESLPLASPSDGQMHRLELGASGLWLEYQSVAATIPGRQGEPVLALAVFLVNRRPVAEGAEADVALAFQVSLELRVTEGLVPRPNHRDQDSEDEDDRIADLQYREVCEAAVGHGIGAEGIRAADGRLVGARTVWLPRACVPLVQTKEDLGDTVTLAMDTLAELPDGPAFHTALDGLAQQYRAWIATSRRQTLSGLTGRRHQTARELMAKAERAAARIEEGIRALADGPDDDLRTAFRLANKAMAMQARQRSPELYKDGRKPTWRPFQLAFILLSLASVGDEGHADRETVELIFFPTGGGKTEAYLGIAAVALVLRRLQGQSRPDAGLGVTVLLRYTLRLLTLDQLGRAATLICALELLRQKDPQRLGAVRFSLGLWVGNKTTPGTLADAREQIDAYRLHDGRESSLPCPLTACPWCRVQFAKSSLELRRGEKGSQAPFDEVRLGCASTGDCPFTLAENQDGLPVVFVDEQLYRELPCFLIATVDKLAMLPYRGETAALFGRALSRRGRHFFNALDEHRDIAQGTSLPEGLRPPELIIQDELHLISGPLGTMVGLYETAVEGLCVRTLADGTRIRPKILASTATVRRAREQITALFARQHHAIFPPAGLDAADSFFGTQEIAGHGRLYLGVAAPGRSTKAVLLRVFVALLGAAQRAWEGGRPGADAYMTLLGYFNSLRELGGMRRLVEDEVRTRAAEIGARKPTSFTGANPWFASRQLNSEPMELTSRESTRHIAEAKARLGESHDRVGSVDVALASNMISVGVDVDRLGLMVVAGQPKTSSEYIQATSRVGRHRSRPGLVVVALNSHKPRDRSHLEHFAAYHEAFYRNVEATSVTPFSGPALARGLAGTLVALARLATPEMNPPEAAQHLERHPEVEAFVLETLRDRAAAVAGAYGEELGDHEGQGSAVADKVAARAQKLFDAWRSLTYEVKDGGDPRVYSRFDIGCRTKKRLLSPRLEAQESNDEHEQRFAAPTSMRDVEPPVHVWVQRKLRREEARDGQE